MSYGSRISNEQAEAWKKQLEAGPIEVQFAVAYGQLTAETVQKAIVAFLRKPSEYGDPCSADREVLAQQIERGEHLK